MFWRLGNLPQDSLDTLLSKESFTLDEVLEEADLLQECKGHNKKLLEYLTQDDIITQLLDYVTKDAPEDAEDKIKFKFPHVAAELLGTDVQVLCNATSKPEHLTHLFTLLDRPAPLSPVLAPYFHKTLDNLLARCSADVIAYMKYREDCVPLLVKHIDSYPIYEVVVNLVSNQISWDSDDLVTWLHSRGLVPRLLNGLAPPCTTDTKNNSADALCTLVRQSGGDGLFATQLQSEDTLTLLINHALDKSEESFLPCMSVLTSMFETFANESVSDSTEGTPAFVSTVCDRLDGIVNLLSQAPSYSITNSAGTLSPPLGRRRLTVIAFLSAILSSNYPLCNQTLIELKALEKCLDLMFEFKWNNLLHVAVSHMVEHVLKSGTPELMSRIVVDYGLPDKIIAAHGRQLAAGNNIAEQVGYMGHLVTISNQIVTAATMNEDTLGAKLVEHSDWESFVKGPLAQITTAQNTLLGGGGHSSKDLAIQNSSDDEPYDQNLFNLLEGESSGDAHTTNLQLILGGKFPADFDNEPSDTERISGLGEFEEDVKNMFDDLDTSSSDDDGAAGDEWETRQITDESEEGAGTESGNWANFDEPSQTSTSNDDGNWANFDEPAQQATTAPSGDTAGDNWANFDEPTPMDVEPTNSADESPGVKSAALPSNNADEGRNDSTQDDFNSFQFWRTELPTIDPNADA